MIKLFVGGFPLDSTELELVQLVSPYAEVSTIKIVRDKITKKCKGYAFLELTDESGADRAMEALDGVTMGDRVLSVNKVIEEAPKPSRPQGSYSKPGFQNTNPANRIKRPRRSV